MESFLSRAFPANFSRSKHLWFVCLQGRMMNKEEFKRCFGHMPKTGLGSLLLFFLHKRVKEFEIEPPKNQPFSQAVAFASVGYALFQIVGAFVRVKYPCCFLFEYLSLICGFAAVVIAMGVVLCNLDGFVV